MFPHSSIAKRYACARTKTHHDVDTLAYEGSNSVAQRMNTSLFSIATDGSNDMETIKLYPVLVSLLVKL